MVILYADKLFSVQNPGTCEAVKLSKVFEMKGYRYLRITEDLKKEHCCFLHFLLGKKRNMSKRNELEVN